MTYKLIQLTNSAATPFGAVAVGGIVPLGTLTHKVGYGCCACNNPTFTITTSGANTVAINDSGYYRVTYSASVVSEAAGLVTLNLVQNGVVVYSVSQTAAAAGDTVNLSYTYFVRVVKPYIEGFTVPSSNLQITNTGATALSGGTSNLTVEKISC